MYKLRPKKVFIHRRVYENPLAVRRMERMLKALGNPPALEIGADDLAAVVDAAGINHKGIAYSGWGSMRQGAFSPQEDPVLLFNTFVWDERRRQTPQQDTPNGNVERLARLMAGVGEDFAFSQRDLVDPSRKFVCQGGWGLHSMSGCVHRCAYCYEGYVLNVMLDLEDFARHCWDMFLRRPEQKVYRYDLYGDQPCLEPEYGASAIMTELFARTKDQYLLFYTKSDNVEHLLDLPHKDRSIFYCTLGTESACRLFETGAPPMDRRIEGLRRCQQAGYRVRVGYSPIVPVVDWRREATESIEKLMAVVQPETVRLWVLSLMSGDELEATLTPERLDPDCLAAARASSMEEIGWWNGPFPRRTRAEIYGHYLDEFRRVSPQTPVSLCSEEPELWDMLAGKVRMDRSHLFCCCGGTSVPSQPVR